MIVELAPSEIRFMHDTIRPQFRNGKGVNQVIEDIYKGVTKIEDIPRIEVTKRNNKYYSLSNRRLYVFRVLQKRKFLSRIEVFLVTRWEEQKYTTKSDGESVKVRRDKTLPHTFDNLSRKKRADSSNNCTAASLANADPIFASSTVVSKSPCVANFNR